MKGETELWDTLLGTQVEDPPTSGEDRIYYTRSPQSQPLSMLRNLGSRSGDYYLLADSLGSTVALTDSNGSLVTRYRYEPYGERLGTPAGPPLPLRFAGQYLDSETGLYKMGVRYYDPTTMRWTQKDPLNLFQDPKQGNRYSYAGADPVNRVDPTGRISAEVGCSYGPIGYSYGQNSDGTVAQGFTGILEGRQPSTLSLSAGCSGIASTGEIDGGGVGLSGCFAVCLGASTDTGLSFGGGLEFGIDLEFDLF